MKLPPIQFNTSRDELFNAQAAIKQLGSIDSLFNALEDLQRSKLPPNFYALAIIGKEGSEQIRATVKRGSWPRPEIAAWLTNHDVPVLAA